jgi:hypothetical protein
MKVPSGQWLSGLRTHLLVEFFNDCRRTRRVVPVDDDKRCGVTSITKRLEQARRCLDKPFAILHASDIKLGSSRKVLLKHLFPKRAIGRTFDSDADCYGTPPSVP